jgi:hypothetical protein
MLDAGFTRPAVICPQMTQMGTMETLHRNAFIAVFRWVGGWIEYRGSKIEHPASL